MSIKISYPEDSAIARAPHNVRDKQQALALDGLDLLLHTLVDVTTRLEEKLLFLSFNKDDLSVKKMRLVISDAWAMVDHAHLACEFIKLAGAKFVGDDLDLVRKLQLIRNSYQHANSRIDEHFVDKGGSVFGNLSWYHSGGGPDTPDDGTIYACLLVTGILLNGSTHGEFEVSDDLSIIRGIKYVDLHYVIKPKTKDEATEMTLRLDDVAALLNKAITHLERTTSSMLDKLAEQRSHHYPERTQWNLGVEPHLLEFKFESE